MKIYAYEFIVNKFLDKATFHANIVDAVKTSTGWSVRTGEWSCTNYYPTLQVSTADGHIYKASIASTTPLSTAKMLLGISLSDYIAEARDRTLLEYDGCLNLIAEELKDDTPNVPEITDKRKR